MPRRDLFGALHPMLGADGAVDRDPGSEDDPELRSYRSGFWATAPVKAGDGPVRVAVRAKLAGGAFEEALLGEIEVGADPSGSPAWDGREPRVAIAMATYNPDPALFRAQVESIRAQSLTDWVCVISDDCSAPETVAEMRAAIAADERFALLTFEEHLGFYANFERALELVPRAAPFVALADQDDRWYPDKLETLVDSIGDANLIYSDQRLIDPDGGVLADTYWTVRRNNHSSLASLLVANTVTGAASLMRREVLHAALPFPRPPGTQYHDQWLALVALAGGRVGYVDRPLYDYVQHAGAALGHEAANAVESLRERADRALTTARRGEWRRFVVGWRSAYFFAYCRLRLLAEVLELRLGEKMDRRSRRMLRRFVRAESSPFAFAWLYGRGLRRFFGQNETMGAEGLIARGILWRHAVGAVAARRSGPAASVYDASLPREASNVRAAAIGHESTRILARMVEPLELSVSEQVPRRVNLLVPTIELKHFFGGYIAKFNLARKLAECGLQTRIVTVDPTPPLPRAWREQVEAYAGLAGMFDRVEVAFARDADAPLQVNPDDAFIATTWWTAHIAGAIMRSVRRERFLYMIQEYEPYTFPMGAWAAMAGSTYELPHFALFSTELLRGFFAARGFGVYASGREQGDEDSLSFQNAITAVEPPTATELARRTRRRLLFYARPEAHGARNMFELGLLALAESVGSGVVGDEWELHGIGTVEGRDRIDVSSTRRLEMLPKLDQPGYARLLAEHDVGLALMSTPHPSLVPLEMASAGMLAVTNSWETKTREGMSALAPNLIAVPPSLEGIVGGLAEAVSRVGDHAARVEGARLDWSRDWDQSFGPGVMTRITELLERT